MSGFDAYAWLKRKQEFYKTLALGQNTSDEAYIQDDETGRYGRAVSLIDNLRKRCEAAEKELESIRPATKMMPCPNCWKPMPIPSPGMYNGVFCQECWKRHSPLAATKEAEGA